jgi:hypothetical protein
VTMLADCTDAGMPDVLLQNRQLNGACCSILIQMSFLKASFSGPCSCTISASLTASDRVVATRRRSVEKSLLMCSFSSGSGLLARFHKF